MFNSPKLKTFNSVPYMPILGFSNSATNKDIMSNIWTNYLIEKNTLWEKEKLHIMSNFSFSYNVFKSSLFRSAKMCIYGVKR